MSPFSQERENIKGKRIDFEKVIGESVEEDPQLKPLCNSNTSGFNSIAFNMGLNSKEQKSNDITKPAPSYDISSLASPIRGPVIISQINRSSPPPICTCTKTGCKKKYCACYQKGYNCNAKCECKFCENNKQEDYGIVYGLNRGFSLQGTRIPVPSHQLLGLGMSAFNNLALHSDVICNCSKSGCTKKYCECYKVGKLCSEACRCENCENNLEFQTKKKLELKEQMEKDVKKETSEEKETAKPFVRKSSLERNLPKSVFSLFGAEAIGIEISNGEMDIKKRSLNLDEKKSKAEKKNSLFFKENAFIKREEFDDVKIKEEKEEDIKIKEEDYSSEEKSEKENSNDEEEEEESSKHEDAKNEKHEVERTPKVQKRTKPIFQEFIGSPILGKKILRSSNKELQSTNLKSAESNCAETSKTAQKLKKKTKFPCKKLEL